MPRIHDTSYNKRLSKPEYYSDAQKEEYIQKRIADIIFEDDIPPVPTRQQELDYLNWLEEDFRKDKWLHTRFRKLQAGPLRRPYKDTRELQTQQRFHNGTNFLIGAILISPLAIFLGRLNRATLTGVPKIHHPENYFRMVDYSPDACARKNFRIGFFLTLGLGGMVYMLYNHQNYFRDQYYSRPDLKPRAPMVEDTEDEAKAKQDFYEKVYPTHRGKQNWKIFKRSALYRLFRPNQADYSLTFEERDPDLLNYNQYKHSSGEYPTKTRMYEQHWN